MSTTGASDLLLAPEEVAFDVERFDWVDDGRLEVVGRWSGVRGLRFVRPVLTVPVAGRRRRIVALLEHKPWVASDGDQWVAAFPWQGHREAVGPAQLAVGPSLVVELPAPGPRQSPVPREPSPADLAAQRAYETETRAARESEAAQALLRREREDHERRRRELEAGLEALRADVAAAGAVADGVRLERAGARARLDDALADNDRLRATHADAEAETARLRATHADAEAETARLRAAHADAEAETARLRAAHADAEAETARLRAHADAEAATHRLRAAHGAAAEQLSDAVAENDRLREKRGAAAEPLRDELARPLEAAPEPAPRPAGTGAADGRRTVKILDGPQRMPEVKPLLVQAQPLKRNAAAVWGRRIAAIVLLLVALVALFILLH